MAAAAQAMRKFDAANDDIMDLRSDSGFNLDDGDIDIDFDPEPTEADDDISLNDAGGDAILDYQTVPADQDEYMIDGEDYIQADMQLGDEMHHDPIQTNNSAAAQVHTPAPLDEDLIDYSDDDDDYQQPTYQQLSSPQAPELTQGVPEAESVVEENHQDKVEAQGTGLGDEHKLDNHRDHVDTEDIATPQTETQELHDETELGAREEAEHVPGSDSSEGAGGVPLEDQAAQIEDSEHQYEDGSDDQQYLETLPVTINYEGNELWLFKQHDTDNSGDWLIEDTSLIHSSLSDLFSAFRASLGENMANETELGLRFDHFHNLELFEDSTACVAVSLGRLLELYYTLHAQDGENEPESFYMCLLSRPRFATLLSDVAKHANEGSGYSGLNSAIAAGETHFIDTYSRQSTEHNGTEWAQEEGGQDEYGQVEDGQDEYGDVEDGQDEYEQVENDQAEYRQDGHDGADNDEEEHTPDDAKAADEAAPPENSITENKGQENAIPEVAEEEHSTADAKHVTSSTPASATRLNQSSPKSASPAAHGTPCCSEKTAQQDAIAKEMAEQLARDTVDYSDDEDEEPKAQTLTSASLPYSDHAATIAAFVDDTDFTRQEEEHQTGQDDSFRDANHVAYDDYGQNKQYDPEHCDVFPLGEEFDGLTNQDDTGYDYQEQDLDSQLQNDLTNGDQANSGVIESANAANDVESVEDLFDLGDAAVWSTGQGQTTEVSGDDAFPDDQFPVQYHEEEDGAVKQPAAAASSAADPIAASSTGLEKSSPQGQKRSRDEAGDSVGDALDALDTKRPRV